MALLLLASTTSWTVEKHFCMGRVMDIAVFHKADDCGMQLLDAEQDMTMDCCSDETIVVKGQEDLKLSFNDLDLTEQLFLTAFTQSYVDLFNVLEQKVVPHKDYPPPLLVSDIQLLDQVFLI